MAGKAKIHRDFKPLVKAAEDLGWVLHPPRGKGHPRLVPPKGWKMPDGSEARSLVIPSTPSDHRNLLNTRAMLRRSGIPC